MAPIPNLNPLPLSHYLHKAFPTALSIEQGWDHPAACMLIRLNTHSSTFAVTVPYDALNDLKNDPWQIAEYVKAKLMCDEKYMLPLTDTPVYMEISQEMMENIPWEHINIPPNIEYQPDYYYSPIAPQQLIQTQQIVVNVGPDLTQFTQSFDAMCKAMAQMSAQLSGEFKKVSDALTPCLEEIAKIVSVEQAQKMPAKAVLNHPSLKQPVKCPGCDKLTSPRSLEKVIVDLNDRHKWTREQIADWLDTLDNQPIFYPEVEEADVA
jgi:hypothetical protein